MIKSRQTSKRRIFANVLILVLLLISAVAYVASRYKVKHFGDAQIDEIIFYFTNGLMDGQAGSLVNAVYDNIVFCLIIFFLLTIPVIDYYRNKISINLDLSFLGKKKSNSYNPSKIGLRFKIVYAIVVFIISVWLLLSSFGAFSYLRSLANPSKFIEQNYVDPKKTSMIFPQKKRNLVYIYLESMENTLVSRENGGQSDTSIISELESIASDPQNISFSNLESGLGGAMPANGTTWTVAGMTAQAGGIPLKTPILIDSNEMSELNKFLPGAYMLGDILKDNGYNQSFIMGSEAGFGGRDKLLTQHGKYNIVDYRYVKDHGKVPSDYNVWWGYEDKKLFKFAEEEMTRLSKLDQPFNLQLLTVDTHFTDGYLDSTCETPFPEQYDNVHSCSSKQVAQFVNWIKQQPFADNTTIILTGDHVGMQTSYYDAKITTPNYRRTVYNAFINSAITPVKEKGRIFSTMDMFPTTLASIGVNIDGDQLGLGVNLFSEKETLPERMGGIEQFNNELSNRSSFYENRLLAGKNK